MLCVVAPYRSRSKFWEELVTCFGLSINLLLVILLVQVRTTFEMLLSITAVALVVVLLASGVIPLIASMKKDKETKGKPDGEDDLEQGDDKKKKKNERTPLLSGSRLSVGAESTSRNSSYTSFDELANANHPASAYNDLLQADIQVEIGGGDDTQPLPPQYRHIIDSDAEFNEQSHIILSGLPSITISAVPEDMPSVAPSTVSTERTTDEAMTSHLIETETHHQLFSSSTSTEDMHHPSSSISDYIPTEEVAVSVIPTSPVQSLHQSPPLPISQSPPPPPPSSSPPPPPPPSSPPSQHSSFVTFPTTTTQQEEEGGGSPAMSPPTMRSDDYSERIHELEDLPPSTESKSTIEPTREEPPTSSAPVQITDEVQLSESDSTIPQQSQSQSQQDE